MSLSEPHLRWHQPKPSCLLQKCWDAGRTPLQALIVDHGAEGYDVSAGGITGTKCSLRDARLSAVMTTVGPEWQKHVYCVIIVFVNLQRSA